MDHIDMEIDEQHIHHGFIAFMPEGRIYHQPGRQGRLTIIVGSYSVIAHYDGLMQGILQLACLFQGEAIPVCVEIRAAIVGITRAQLIEAVGERAIALVGWALEQRRIAGIWGQTPGIPAGISVIRPGA